MNTQDTYKTIDRATEEILFKEKGSKFLGYAYPIRCEEEVKPLIETLRKVHPNARHHCYAFQIGAEKIYYRTNDDGEPNNTAGTPIYGQIQSFGLTNILVVVVRYFGGTKLGVGGLIAAYKTTAQATLDSCNIIEKTVDVSFLISFDYQNMNKAMRIIKEKKLEIVHQQMEIHPESELPIGKIEFKTRKKNAEIIFDIFNSHHEINIQIIE
ncbi:YigZ family protein [Flavobacterium sp. UMI-01]|uniref:IMPACT family protein n=1 Tax=Flavobacterium sp. UMI-01 TaxID=1441053 RepID=UPI001C7CBFFF|nr:YigZ family protein [Flavobacterium sp. UMI-01]GIZ08754.1 hypothetical protein FUMI01_14810 [Flavobacterium sp. UMI-01]